MAREGAVRRQKMRSSPRVERLEGRIVMSTFRVNTTLDTVAADLRTGKDATGHISLRSAIEAANMRGGNNTIIVPGGTFTLTIAGANEDNAATGDLDISGNLTIKGKKAAASIIDANGLDRVFQVIRGKVKISNVTIEHGMATEGGGLLNSGGQVTLSSVIVTNNEALGAAGVAGKPGATRFQTVTRAPTALRAAPPWAAASATRAARSPSPRAQSSPILRRGAMVGVVAMADRAMAPMALPASPAALVLAGTAVRAGRVARRRGAGYLIGRE